MKICLITKYPPIQGGVSTTSFWMAHGLAAHGHEVHVISNAEEAEIFYRTLPQKEQSETTEKNKPIIHFTTTNTPKHIPFSRIFFTKLMSLGMDVCNKYGCDLIFSYYLEPYGMVGAFLSEIIGVPFVLRHAGSDISRLLGNENLRSAYTYAIKKSTIIITSPATANKLIDIGVDKNKLVYAMKDLFPPNYYFPKGDDTTGVDDSLTIGIYNKFSKNKGIEEVIEALDRISKKNIKFNLRIVSGGELLPSLVEKLENSSTELQSATSIRKFIHPQDIPDFIRSCDIVCNLEHQFPVVSHYPRIPREILMCGSCLMLSEELYQKMRFRHLLKNMENFVLVKNPRNIGLLSETFEMLLCDKKRVERIGNNGAKLFVDRDVVYANSIDETSNLLDDARYRFHISNL